MGAKGGGESGNGKSGDGDGGSGEWRTVKTEGSDGGCGSGIIFFCVELVVLLWNWLFVVELVVCCGIG